MTASLALSRCRLGVRLFTTQICEVERRSQVELLDGQDGWGNGLGGRQGILDGERPVRQPVRPVRLVLVPHALQHRELAHCRGLRQVALDGVLPDALVADEAIHVLAGLFLVLAVLQQHRASGPEDRAAGAVFGLRQRAEANLARILPGAGEAQVRILVLDVVRNLL